MDPKKSKKVTAKDHWQLDVVSPEEVVSIPYFKVISSKIELLFTL